MQLCDKDIYKALSKGDIVFLGTNEKYPFLPERQVQASTVDLRLGNRFMKFDENVKILDLAIHKASDFMKTYVLEDEEPFLIEPNQIVFAHIYEQVYINTMYAGRIEGRSRTARVGISIHCTGSNMNPGFRGCVAIQIKNNNHFPIVIYPYMDICQMMFYQLTDSPLLPFGFFDEPYQDEEYPAPSILTSKSSVICDDNSVIRKRAQILLEQYNKMIDNDLKSPKDKLSNISVYMGDYIENIENVLKETKMGDTYKAKQVGVQGNKAGKYAKIDQKYDNMNNDEKLEKIMNEINELKKYLRGNEQTDEGDIILGNLANASIQIKKNNINSAFQFIKKGGKELYDVAKSIGCIMIAEYLNGTLGLK